MTTPPTCLVIGIGGGSASGKTSLARALHAALGAERARLIGEDDYYRCASSLPGFDAARWNFDHPDAKDFSLLSAHLAALKAGRAAEKPLYDYVTHTRRPQVEPVAPAPVILLEGILHLADPAVRAHVDFAVFVHAADDLRLARRVLRDVAERGRRAEDVVRQYLSTVRPMHEAFVAPQLSSVDLVADGTTAPEALARDVLLALAARGLA